MVRNHQLKHVRFPNALQEWQHTPNEDTYPSADKSRQVALGSKGNFRGAPETLNSVYVPAAPILQLSCELPLRRKKVEEFNGVAGGLEEASYKSRKEMNNL